MKNNFRLHGRLKTMLCACVLLLTFGFSSGQTKTISGEVSGDGIPLPGASIVIKGANVGTLTDFDGLYSLEAEVGDVIKISYVGFLDKEITVGESSKIDIELIVNVSDLEEVIVVGYQTQKKSELTGAISTVKGDQLRKQAVGNFAEALQGQVAGVSVQVASGAPGAKVNVQIRGANNLNEQDDFDGNPAAGIANPFANGTGPLWVVDGVPFQRDPNLSSGEIESVEVLKDAASTAIYGVRAAAGVILVTTKRGKKGTTKVDFSTYTSVNKINSRVPTLNTNEAFLVNFNLIQNDVSLGNFRQSGILNRNPRAILFNNDFQDLVQNDNALTFNANVNLSGGSDDLTYSLTLDYLDQDGVFVNSDLKRTNARLNTNFKKNKFSVFSTISLSDSDISLEPWRILYDAIVAPPFEQTGDGSGVFSGTVDAGNNFGNISRNLLSTNDRNIFSASAYASFNYDWFPGFRTKVNLSASTYQISDRFFEPQFDFIELETGNLTNSQQARLRLRDGVGNNGLQEYITEYNKDFSGHKVSLLAGYTRESKTWTQRGTTVLGFPDGVIPSANRSQNANESLVTETIAPVRIVSYLGTLGYGYKGKYLFRGNIRRDGSSNFNGDNIFSNFGGASVGWVVSKESFFENSEFLSFIQQLKFRASYGEVGNQNIDPFQFQAPVSQGFNLPGNSGSAQSRLGNPDLRWERSVTKNLGLDLNLFNGALTFTGELYETKKKDLLLDTNLPISIGTDPSQGGRPATVVTNIGELTNQGVELSLGYKESSGDFKWGINGTFTQNINEITRLASSSSQIAGGQVTPGTNILPVGPVTFGRVGFQVGSFFLLDSDGLIRNQEELDAYRTLGGLAENAVIGDVRYRDANGDGTLDFANDRVFKGTGVPDFEVGLNYNMSYKNFDFSMQWFASVGSVIYNSPKALALQRQNHKELLFSFNPGVNENTDIPINRQGRSSLNITPFSDRFLEDGDYLRLRNVQIGYTLPEEALQELGISKLRIYLAGSNLLTITDYTGFDPEVGGNGLFSRGIDRGFTPVTGSGRLGIELTF